MAITLVQKNGSANTGTLNAAPPAWSVTPTVGNLLLIVGAEAQNTNSTWPTTPAGYTAFASTPFRFYTAGVEGAHGLYWKIASAAEATPGHYGETSGTQDWVTYTYEFANSGGGWVAAAADREVHSAASSTAGTTKASGSTATLSQANELAICLLATSVVVTAGAFSGGFSLAQPTTANGKLFVGWQATAATTALATTATWITSARSGVKIATFKAAASGTVYTQSLAASVSFSGAAPTKKVNRRVTASVTPTGSVSRTPIARLVFASLRPVGSLTLMQILARALTPSAFQPSGAVNAATSRSLAASFTPTGVLSNLKSIARSLTASFTPVGSVTRLPGKVMTALLTPVGALSRALSLHQILDAAVLQPVGVLAKATSRNLPAVLRPVGMVASASRGALSGVFRPVGVMSHGLQARTLTAVLQPLGSISGRSITRLLVSSLVASGVLHTRYIPPVGPLPRGGGGFGAVMSDGFFRRYEVDAKWRHMKRPKL